ncbi:50S ribosomal protein L18 [Candidatus Uhrbacteria bacterium]|nr:50S ribosomal protein L18 [Candidatus Uhrbacteria bacterium]
MKPKDSQKQKREIRERRHRRVRAKIFGTPTRPRLSVFRSAKHTSAQLIDDVNGRTLVAASDRDVKLEKGSGKVGAAEAVGKLLAERATAKNLVQVVFDRGGYAYHGRVEAVARGARGGGLKF